LPFELYTNTFTPRYQTSDAMSKLVGQVSPKTTPEIRLTPTIQKHKDSTFEV